LERDDGHLVEAGGEALRHVSRFLLHRRGDGDLAGHRPSLSGNGHIDGPFSCEILLHLRPVAAVCGRAPEEFLEVLVLRAAAPGGRRG
jgi:hypothetical protein